MEPLLFLAHRLPYPPDKGDKIRSFNVLNHLAQRYRVYLGTFIDDPADARHVEALERRCAGIYVEPLYKLAKGFRSALGLCKGMPLTASCYYSRAMEQWASRVVQRERIVHAYAFSSCMAQYLLDLPVRCIVDFVDVDSAKWEEYGTRRWPPASLLYKLEARRLANFEQLVAGCADASIFVSEEEAKRFRCGLDAPAPRLVAMPNGVDSTYFSPVHSFANPFGARESAVVFTGAMDYWPNADGAVWFAREVLPRLREQEPSVRFYVVGRNPGMRVKALAGNATEVTGTVADVRPYLSHARAVVAPLRVARGIQNKVLEAMAMARPVVASFAAAEGLSVEHGVDIEVANNAEAFAAKVLKILTNGSKADALGCAARARMLRDYSWSSCLKRLEAVLRMPAHKAYGGAQA